MGRYYVIPDIHGRKDLLDMALAHIYEHNRDGGKIIFLGDYIDRGSDNRGVLDTVMNPPKNWEFICLLGNHEEMFVRACLGFEEFYDFKAYQEFVPEANQFDRRLRQMPNKYIHWMMNLPMFHHEDKNVFAHAWYDCNISPDNQDQNVLLWARVSDSMAFPGDKYLVHGHTPRRTGPTEARGRTNLDCGAVMYGRLVIAEMKTGVMGPYAYHEFKGEDYVY